MSQKYNFIAGKNSIMTSWDGNANPANEGGAYQAQSALPLDPVRRDYGALWFSHEEEPRPRLRFGRDSVDVTSTSLIQGVATSTILVAGLSGFVPSPSTPALVGWDTPPNPFGKINQRIAIYGNTEKFTSLEQWREYVIANYYGRNTGLSVGDPSQNEFKHFYDYTFNYNSPYTPLETLRLNLDGVADPASTRFDYNFYAAKYEHVIGQDLSAGGAGASTLYPHLYTIYFEADRNMGLTDIEDVPLGAPRIREGDYNQEYTYHDFVTLDRELKDVFVNTLRKDFTRVPGPDLGTAEKAGEGDRARYYNSWADTYANILAGSLSVHHRMDMAVLRDRYQNIFLTRRSAREYQTFNRYKELFPMYTEVRFPFEAVPGPIATGFHAEHAEAFESFSGRGLHLNVIQNIWFDMALSPGQYTGLFLSAEEHQAFDTIEYAEGGQDAFDLTQYCLDSFYDTSVVGPAGRGDEYLLFREYPEAGQEIDPDTGLIRDSDAPAYSMPDEDFVSHDDPPGLTAVAGQLLGQIKATARDNLRSYTQVLNGEKSATIPVFYRINKYRYMNGARGDLIQTYIIPEGDELFDFLPSSGGIFTPEEPKGPNSNPQPEPPPEVRSRGYKGVFELIDTQMRYDENYEYEILLNTLVVGTKTKFRHLYVPVWTGTSDFTTGEPINELYSYSPGGAHPEEVDEFEGYSLGSDPLVVSDPSYVGPPRPDPRLQDPALNETRAYARFSGDTDPDNPYYAMMDVVTQPSIQIVETPYAVARPSWSDQDASFGIGTILDNPSVAPFVDITPYRAINDKLLIKLNAGIGSRRMVPTALNTNDEDYLNRLRAMNVDPEDMSIIFENDDPATTFEVYRLDRKPTSYDDFRDHKIATVDTDGPITNFRKLSAAAFRDTVVPNTKYYYVFRSLDFHGHSSRPTAVYEVELRDNDGAVYPVIRMAPFPTMSDYRTNQKKLTRFLQISPQLLQTAFNEGETGTWNVDGTPNSATTAPFSGDVSLGFEDERIWGRTFKIRVTSRKTGKKIDLNVRMKKEYNSERPLVLTYDPPTAATPMGDIDSTATPTFGPTGGADDDTDVSPY